MRFVDNHQVPGNLLQALDNSILLGKVERGNTLAIAVPDIACQLIAHHFGVDDFNVSSNLLYNSSCHWMVKGAGVRISTELMTPRSFSSFSSNPAMIVLPAPGSSANKKRSRAWGNIRSYTACNW